MSYSTRQPYGPVVVCDLCERFGAVFDNDWREMRRDSQGQPIHLCRACRRSAVWCEEHKLYHYADARHRCHCVDCDGLFTTMVRSGVSRCPSCLRAVQPAQPAAAPRRPHPVLALFWRFRAAANLRL